MTLSRGYDADMACTRCGFDGHNSRTCPGPHQTCPTCGKPTANMTDYSERNDGSYCSALTSPGCWDWENAVVTTEP